MKQQYDVLETHENDQVYLKHSIGATEEGPGKEKTVQYPRYSQNRS